METGRYSRLTQSPAVSSRLRSDYTAHLASHGEHEKSRQVGRVGVLIQIFVSQPECTIFLYGTPRLNRQTAFADCSAPRARTVHERPTSSRPPFQSRAGDTEEDEAELGRAQTGCVAVLSVLRRLLRSVGDSLASLFFSSASSLTNAVLG